MKQISAIRNTGSFAFVHYVTENGAEAYLAIPEHEVGNPKKRIYPKRAIAHMTLWEKVQKGDRVFFGHILGSSVPLCAHPFY